MTISELVERKEKICSVSSRTSDTIKQTNDAYAKISKLERSTDADGKEAINLARVATNNLIMDLDECRKLLQDYSFLLEAIMRQTEVTWPPKCDGERQ